VGRGTGTSREDAERRALDDALARLASEVGLVVSASTRSTQSESRGVAESSVVVDVRTATGALRLEGVQTDARHVAAAADGALDAWVRVTLPKPAWEALRLRAEGRTVLVASCAEDSGAPAPCPASVTDALTAGATRAGLRLTPAVWSGPLEAAPAELARDARAALALRVRLAAAFAGESNGEFYARATGTAELLDTTSGKVVGSAQAGPAKGGAYSRADALRRALDQVARDLSQRLPAGGDGP